MMSAEISEKGESLTIEKVVPLFQAKNPNGTTGWPYDVTADGKKFILSSQGEQMITQPLTLVVNWPELLKKE